MTRRVIGCELQVRDVTSVMTCYQLIALAVWRLVASIIDTVSSAPSAVRLNPSFITELVYKQYRIYILVSKTTPKRTDKHE